MTTYWLIPSDPLKFDVRGALEKFGRCIDWKKNSAIQYNDIIYLYEAKNKKAIIAKFIVINDYITNKTKFKDEEFWKAKSNFSLKGYFRMQLVSFFEKPLTKEWLKENGLKSNIQSAEKIKGNLLMNIRLKEFEKEIMEFPALKKSSRAREFNQYGRESISDVIEAYLLAGKSHRKIDEEDLDLNSSQTKGYPTMGILHYLGLDDRHKGIFHYLNKDESNFILRQVGALEILDYLDDNTSYTKEKEIKVINELETVIRAKEGEKVKVYTYKYERKPKLRAKAIEIHGTTCKVCRFNFEDYYGELGRDFIEIHHLKPLSSSEEEIEVNPATDLVPVCSNCHRMIHRKKDEIVSIEELKEIQGIK
ncbi:HNH endonuclease [Listeria seeligeri]|uniref:HNH endonuclease n=1 Tax=Listeria seeligeri TaxID=1640 RepID=UPI00162AA920|nr:HNH endonuclease [Listeria seeligeri]MBC1899537.1 EVE domain-containing protein [Listeria seeligeri]MBF2562779.1 EVE domain-containing protein [Listeria seeligeri]